MAQLGVLLVLNAVLQPDERVGALQSRLHLQCIQLIHIIDLLGVFISSDNKTITFLVVDGVAHAAHLHRNLVGPAILDLSKYASNSDQAGSLIHYTVCLVHDEQAISTHLACEFSFYEADLLGPCEGDGASGGHGVLRSKIDGVGGLLSYPYVRLVQSELGYLSCVLVSNSRRVLGVSSDLVEVLVDYHNVSKGVGWLGRNRVLDVVCAPLECSVSVGQLIDDNVHDVATDSALYLLKPEDLLAVQLCGRARRLNLGRELVAELIPSFEGDICLHRKDVLILYSVNEVSLSRGESS